MPYKDPEAKRACQRRSSKKPAVRQKRNQYMARYRLTHPRQLSVQSLEKKRARNRMLAKSKRDALRIQEALDPVLKEANTAKRKMYHDGYYAKNQAKLQEKQRVYQQTHPAIIQVNNSRRRARKIGTALNTLTHAEWISIQEAQDHRCAYCGKRYKGRLTQDHITPLSQGGLHTLHNVIGACRSCNSKKYIGPPLNPVQPLLLALVPNKKKKVS